MKKLTINCPQCSEPTAWYNNPHRPFCSDRCRLIDLGQWANESYRVPGPSQEPFSDENIIFINDKKQDFERS